MMPYEWTGKDPQGRATELHMWPHQSLSAPGYVWFLAATFALVCVPLLMVVGSVILWGLLPFVLLATGGMWLALDRNRRRARILEVLRLEGDQVRLMRHDPDGRVRDWQANRYWATAELHATGGPVPHYLTLRGNGRTVEIGAFLSEAERRHLYDDLLRTLARDTG
jgi:uncharacterized membrane protein